MPEPTFMEAMDAALDDGSTQDTEQPTAESSSAAPPDDPGTPDGDERQPAVEEPIDEQLPESAAEIVAADQPPEEPPSGQPADVPEGATLRNRNGKDEIVYPKERGLAVYGGYKMAQRGEEIFGEPLTEQAMTSRQNAFDWLENQRTDFTSGSVDSQADVFRNLFRDGATAIKNGEIGHDPLDTAGEAFLTTLRDVSPDHYEKLATEMLNDRLEGFYRDAAKSGNDRLFKAVQNIDHFLNGRYRDPEDVKRTLPDEISEREAAIQERERRLAQHERAQRNAAIEAWNRDTRSKIDASVSSVISDQIPEAVRTAFESTPNGKSRLAQITELLRGEFKKALAGDQNWATANNNLFRQVEIAPSERRRAELQTQIVQRYQQKARSVIAAKAKALLDAETAAIVSSSTAHTKRQQAAAGQKPLGSGVGIPPARSLAQSLEGKSFAQALDMILPT
jgi:hypothetical protein